MILNDGQLYNFVGADQRRDENRAVRDFCIRLHSALHKPYIAGSCCCDILANSRFIKGRS